MSILFLFYLFLCLCLCVYALASELGGTVGVDVYVLLFTIIMMTILIDERLVGVAALNDIHDWSPPCSLRSSFDSSRKRRKTLLFHIQCSSDIITLWP